MMKKNIWLLMALLMSSVVAMAQEELGNPKVYTVPAVFYPTDEVTFYFDMADAGFKDGEELYWWVWQPTEPDAGNWENSSDFAKLEYLGDNMYKKTFVPVDYFFQNQTRFATKDELLAFMEQDWGEAGFWSRLKTKNGQIQSGVFCVEHNRTEIADFAASGNEYQIFSGDKTVGYTDKWTMNKPLSILFNGDLLKIEGRTLNEWASDGDFKFFGTHAGLHGFYTNQNDEVVEYDFSDPPAPNLNQQFNVWRPGCIEKTSLKQIGHGVWRWNLTIPQEYFCYNPVNEDEGGIKGTHGYYYLTDMGMTQNGNWAPNPDFVASFVAQELKFGIVVNEWAHSGWGFEFKAGTAEAYPDPSFSTFPSRITLKDILTLTRQWNERTAGVLTYEICAGEKTVKGEMDGNRDRRSVTVNLTDEFKGGSDSELKIRIFNAKGAEVESKTIMLTKED